MKRPVFFLAPWSAAIGPLLVGPLYISSYDSLMVVRVLGNEAMRHLADLDRAALHSVDLRIEALIDLAALVEGAVVDVAVAGTAGAADDDTLRVLSE